MMARTSKFTAAVAVAIALAVAVEHEVAAFALSPGASRLTGGSPIQRKTVHAIGTKSSVRVPTTEDRSRDRVALKRDTELSSTAAVAVDAGGAQDDSTGGTATMSSEIFNLVKNIVGAGVLSLPAGVAAFGNAPTAILPAAALITVIGGVSGYCFSLIGRVCSYTGARTYRECWDETVGTKSSWIPAASCTLKTSLAVTAYSMILADTFQKLLLTAGVSLSRSSTLFGVTGLVLLPLCLLKNLASLAPFSLLGIIGMAFTTLAMGVRYMGGAYKESGKFYGDIPEAFRPKFGQKGAAAVFTPSSFILICMLSTAYMAHFNAPKFYIELKDNTIKRYNTVVGTSFAVSVATFIGITALGFLTFGSSSSGLILNNYSTKDALMSLSRVAVAVSIVFSYPLAFVGVRDGVLDLAKVPVEKRTNATLNKLTVGCLAVVTAAALKIKDLSFLLSFGGATFGNALIYVYPALMYRSAIKNMGAKATNGQKTEVKFAMLTALLGVGMGAVGAKMALKSVLAG